MVKQDMEQPEKQQHDPAGLGDSEKSGKTNGHALSVVTNSNDFSSTPNVNTGFNAGISPGMSPGMDYTQMMQFMSGNMASGMGNFNPMLGMLTPALLCKMVLILLCRNAKYGNGSDARDVWEHG